MPRPFFGQSKLPHWTRCPRLGISALPEFGAYLAERHRGELADMLRRQPIPMVDVLAVPSAGKGLDDPRRFAAVQVESRVEFRPRPIACEPLTCPDVVAQFAARKVQESALCEAGKVLARKTAEAISPGKLPDRPLHFGGLGLEERREAGNDRSGEGFDRGHLGHLAKIGAASHFPRVSINRQREGGHHVHETRLPGDVNTQPVQVWGEFGASGGERNLGEKPEGMEKDRVLRGGLQRRLGSFRRRSHDDLSRRPGAQHIDDLTPLAGLRKSPQPYVAQPRFLPGAQGAARTALARGKKSRLLLTPRLPKNADTTG